MKSYNIAVAGTGYVGMSLSVLLAQHNKVTAVDIIPERVGLINDYKSPIRDEYIEKYLYEAEKNVRLLNLTRLQRIPPPLSVSVGGGNVHDTAGRRILSNYSLHYRNWLHSGQYPGTGNNEKKSSKRTIKKEVH